MFAAFSISTTVQLLSRLEGKHVMFALFFEVWVPFFWGVGGGGRASFLMS